MTKPRDEDCVVDTSDRLKEAKVVIAMHEDMNSSAVRNTLGTGKNTGIHVVIGARGHLNRHEARLAAKAWKTAHTQYPDATLMLSVSGYDDDPRGLHEIEEVYRYVRQWARFADMNDYPTAVQCCDEGSVRLLTVCDVFGEYWKP